jgi:prepilin-type N-terminal cleavage/methylation domain-containing protein
MDQFAARRRMRGQGGFTLIELLVVVAILAVLGGAVIIGVGSLRGNAKAEVCKTDKQTVETAIQAYNVSNPNATLTALSQLTGTGLLKKNYNATDWVLQADNETVKNSTATGAKYATVAQADCP